MPPSTSHKPSGSLLSGGFRSPERSALLEPEGGISEHDVTRPLGVGYQVAAAAYPEGLPDAMPTPRIPAESHPAFAGHATETPLLAEFKDEPPTPRKLPPIAYPDDDLSLTPLPSFRFQSKEERVDPSLLVSSRPPPPVLLDVPRASLPSIRMEQDRRRHRLKPIVSLLLLVFSTALLAAGLGFRLGMGVFSRAPSASHQPLPTEPSPVAARETNGTSADVGSPQPTSSLPDTLAASGAESAAPAVAPPDREIPSAAATSKGKARADHALPESAASDVPSDAEASPFDRQSAASVLSEALENAKSCLGEAAGGGVVRVAVTFAPSGHVTQAVVEGPPYAGTPVGSCIASRLRGVSVPNFRGEMVTVHKSMGW